MNGKEIIISVLTICIIIILPQTILNALEIEKADIIGYSDGGIVGLLLAMNAPEKTGKVISISPNLFSSKESIAEWDMEMTADYSNYIDSMIGIGDTSQNWKGEKLHTDLLLNEPNIPLQDLSKIKSPVLVVAADDDIIKLEHILDIYHAIPKAQLNIFPGATHFLLFDEVEKFNIEARRFIMDPFERPTSKDEVLKLINGEK